MQLEAPQTQGHLGPPQWSLFSFGSGVNTSPRSGQRPWCPARETEYASVTAISLGNRKYFPRSVDEETEAKGGTSEIFQGGGRAKSCEVRTRS